MQIGLDCFLDEQLKTMIKTENRQGDCEISGKKGCIVYDTEQDHYLEEYLEEIIGLFTVAAHLGVSDQDTRATYMREYLMKWQLFSANEDQIQKIITSICHERYLDEPQLFDDKVVIREMLSADEMNQKCILKNFSWENFCYNIKHVNRFHSDYVNLEQLANLLKNMEIDIKVKDYQLRLFRSRICDEEHYIPGYDKRHMGAPPVDFTSSGRTNSEGIQCLYLADQAETTFHEVRARDNDHVCIGEFLQKRDLRIVDFSFFDRISPFLNQDFDITWLAINMEIIRKIGHEIAKPMRRFDKTLDYVPTQYICDYVKHLGYDGIKYKSTLMKDGVNYAIFDEKKFECVGVKVVEIGDVVYRCEEVDG